MTKVEIISVAKPILFNTEMVRAIINDRKTHTRRVVKPQPVESVNFYKLEGAIWGKDVSYFAPMPGHSLYNRLPYKPGDFLYVRETFYKDTLRYLYKADYTDNEKFYVDGKEIIVKWKPSIHMPKEAARIFLKVINVKIERLQNISLEDAISEGCNGTFTGNGEAIGSGWDVLPQEEFKKIWDSTIKKSDYDKYSFEANPWVYNYRFKRIEVEG